MLTIHGRVQGVFFRQETKKKAIALGLSGYIKNLNYGDVEIIASGPELRLLELIEWCRKGPENAQVTSVDINWIAEKKFESFTIKY